MKKNYMSYTFMSALALCIALSSTSYAAQSDMKYDLQKKKDKKDKNVGGGTVYDPGLGIERPA